MRPCTKVPDMVRRLRLLKPPSEQPLANFMLFCCTFENLTKTGALEAMALCRRSVSGRSCRSMRVLHNTQTQSEPWHACILQWPDVGAVRVLWACHTPALGQGAFGLQRAHRCQACSRRHFYGLRRRPHPARRASLSEFELWLTHKKAEGHSRSAV